MDGSNRIAVLTRDRCHPTVLAFGCGASDEGGPRPGRILPLAFDLDLSPVHIPLVFSSGPSDEEVTIAEQTDLGDRIPCQAPEQDGVQEVTFSGQGGDDRIGTVGDARHVDRRLSSTEREPAIWFVSITARMQ